MEWHRFFTGAPYGRGDKAIHFIASAAIAAVLLIVLPVWPAACLALTIGVLKELFDRVGRRARLSASDLLADILGVAFVVSVFFIVASWY